MSIFIFLSNATVFFFSLSASADEIFSIFSMAVVNLDSCSMSASSALVHTCSLSS